jgi:ferredoxin
MLSDCASGGGGVTASPTALGTRPAGAVGVADAIGANLPVALRVDRIRCDGYGMCAELVPELIELDEWGYPIVRPGTVPSELLARARRAVDVCPLLALRLDSARGPTATATPAALGVIGASRRG